MLNSVNMIFSKGTRFHRLLLLLAIFFVFVTRVDGSEEHEVPEIINTFKATLMHFSEAYLKDAKIDGHSLEGEDIRRMADTVIEAIEILPKDLDNKSYDDLNEFKAGLKSGIEITERILSKSTMYKPRNGRERYDFYRELVENTKQDALDVQGLILGKLEARSGARLIIPSGWKGHATALILKQGTKSDTFDMTVVNTGSGVSFHQQHEDPNGIYPMLTRVWIEFKDIPKNELFSTNAWFCMALILLKSEFFADRMKNDLGAYFYTAILGHFKEYVAEPKNSEEDNRLMPMQRSGSCTLSSLLASLMYVCDSMENYALYRLKIGHVLVSNFLNFLNDPGNKSESDYFKKLISDGMHVQGRYFFKSLTSGLALQTLQYLEIIFPGDFMHSGLIGSNQSEWLFVKKENALSKLNTSEETLSNMRNTVKLSSEMLKILQDNSIEEKTYKITIEEDIRKDFDTNTQLKDIFAMDSGTVGQNGNDSNESATALIEATPYRCVMDDIDNFEGLYEAMEVLGDTKSTDKKHFYKLLDIFKFSFGGSAEKLKEILNQETEDKRGQYIEFLDQCENLQAKKDEMDKMNYKIDINDSSRYEIYHFVKNFTDSENDKQSETFEKIANIYDSLGKQQKLLKMIEICNDIINRFILQKKKPISMDEFLMLGVLQRFVWEAVVAYDNLLEDPDKIGFGEMLPPRTLQSVVKYVLPFGYLDLYLRNIYDHQNFLEFWDFINPEPITNEADNQKVFNGPEKLFPVGREIHHDRDTIHEYQSTDLKMMNHPKIRHINSNRSSIFDSWILSHISDLAGGDDEVKYRIILTQRKMVENNVSGYYDGSKPIFKHYYLLMRILSKVRQCAMITREMEENDKTEITNGYWADRISMEDIFVPDCFKLSERPENRSQLFSFFDDKFVINCKEDLSIINSHYNNLDMFYDLMHSRTSNIYVTNFEVWLNYIENAKSAKIFDAAKFQYLTDRILNIPKYHDDVIETFIFDPISSYRAISQLTRLIKVSLLELTNRDKNDLPYSVRKIWVHRAVNISVLLTRFISRIDAENILSGNECADMLAKVYSTILPYANFKATFRLQKAEISRLNFALSHICSVSIRNPLTFMQKIENTLNIETIQKHRKTLERFHSFMAKTNYCVEGSSESVSDDQYIYGTIGSPVAANESEFLKKLLKSFFINDLVFITNPEDLEVFSYHINGYTIKISSRSNSEDYIILNLYSGAIIQNGSLILNPAIFFNLPTFSKFVSQEDFRTATKGITLQNADKTIYYLPDFKGARYIFLLYTIDASDDMIIYRYWNDSWYKWIPIDAQNNSNLTNVFRFQWTKSSKFFIKNTESEDKALLIIRDNEIDPIIRMKLNDDAEPTVDIEVFGFDDEDEDLNRNWKFAKLKNADSERLFLKNTHIGRFDPLANVVKAKGDKLFFICTGYRFSTDLRRPLILNEQINIDEAREFGVLNISGLNVCSDQTLAGGISLLGALVAEKDGKQLLLVPLMQQHDDTKTDTNNYTSYKFIKEDFIQVQRIPLIKGIPAPQSRMDKLLLAYIFMWNNNYSIAKELLNPNTSIHQNEPFSLEELAIMSWIADINSQVPEIIALKLITYVHYQINLLKFSTEYAQTQSLDEYVEKLKMLNNILFNYMLSFRELSEKYHIHRIFPEILRENVFALIFGKSWTKLSGDFSGSIIGDYEKNISNVWEIIGVDLDVKDIIKYAYSTCYQKPDNEDAKEYYDIAKKLLLWNHASENDYIRMTYCLFQNREAWNEFWKNHSYGYDAPDFFNEVNVQKRSEDISTFFQTNCPETLQNCPNTFEGINFDETSSYTEFDKMHSTLQQSSTKYKDKSDYEQNGFKDHQLQVDEEFIKSCKLIRETLLEFIQDPSTDEANAVNYFENEVVSKSGVLRQLNGSISDYIKETRTKEISEVNLHIENIADEEENFINKLAIFVNYLVDLINRYEDRQREQSTELGARINFEIANLDDSDEISKIFELLTRSMHQKKGKKFTSLYKCILDEYPVSCIQKKFPQLSTETCEELVPESFIFYQRLNLIRYLKMILKTSQEFLNSAQSNTAINVDDLIKFCDELDKARYFSSRSDNRVNVIFELQSEKYFLKTDQVDDIKKLTNFNEETKLFNSIVIQRMMAAGKTFVLGTNSIVIKALKSKQTLSILVPPSSLYQSNTTSMQSRTYKYFKKKGKMFIFNRIGINEKASKYLDTVIDIIEDVMDNRDYLILSPDSLHSFLNSYIEALLFGDTNNSLHQDILQKYAKIYLIFKEQSSIILDEIDMTMDPKKELNFPSFENESFNMTAVALIADIMEFIVFDKDVIEAGLNIHSNNQASLTADSFIECRNLILGYIKNQLETENSLWYHLIIEKIENIDLDGIENNFIDEFKDNAVEFLTKAEMTAKKDWIETVHKVDKIVANTLIIVKSILYRYMEDSLKGTVNLNYGSAGKVRPQIKFAVPYVAANTPSPASVFADRWETLLKTLIMVCSSPCSEEISKEVIKYVKKAIFHEFSAETVSLENTETFKTMSILLPKNLTPLDLEVKEENHVRSVQKSLSTRSPAAIRILLDYYVNEVFSEMNFPIVQITSNALNMTSMFGSVQGYSGTIDNVNILPQETVAAAHEDHINNEKYNGGIVLKLMKDSGQDDVHEVDEFVFSKSAIEMVTELHEKFKDNPVSAIIDAGAFFKMFRNQQVAKAILDVYKDKGKNVVLYYNEDSNQLEFIKRDGTIGFLDNTEADAIERTTQAGIDARFTFYDQRHITGSDIPQPSKAHAIMTVGPRILLRDILQGTLRMRQFMKSQKVHLATTKATRLFYGSKIGRESITVMKTADLLALGSINEDEKQAQENEKLAFVKIDSEIRSFILSNVSILIAKGPDVSLAFEKAKKLFQSSKNLFIRKISENPLSWVTDNNQEDTVKTLKHYMNLRLNPLKKLIVSEENATSIDPETLNTRSLALLRHKIKKMISIARKSNADSLLHYLNNTIAKRIGIESETEVQMEVQAETDTQTLVEMDVNMENLTINISPNDIQVGVLPKDIPERLSYGTDKSITEIAATGEILTSLNDLYLKHIDGSHKDIVSNLLLTDGNHIGVTKDLSRPFQSFTISNTYNLIFSKFTSEGSHFLIDKMTVQLPNFETEERLRVVLLSTKAATDSYLQILNESHWRHEKIKSRFWICDLSGSITHSPDNSLRGESIYKHFPEISGLIFDLLTFNGSLSQILDNPILRHIYYTIWLKGPHRQMRAKFLLLRMKLLQEKDKVVFDDDDKDIYELKLIAAGESEKSKSTASKEKVQRESEVYRKRSIDANLNSEISTRMGLTVDYSGFWNDSVNINVEEALLSFFGDKYDREFKFSSDNSQALEVPAEGDIGNDAVADDSNEFVSLKNDLPEITGKNMKIFTTYIELPADFDLEQTESPVEVDEELEIEEDQIDTDISDIESESETYDESDQGSDNTSGHNLPSTKPSSDNSSTGPVHNPSTGPDNISSDNNNMTILLAVSIVIIIAIAVGIKIFTAYKEKEKLDEEEAIQDSTQSEYEEPQNNVENQEES